MSYDDVTMFCRREVPPLSAGGSPMLPGRKAS